MKVGDKAETGPDVYLAPELIESEYKLKSMELTEAADIGSDEYPQYGDFAKARERSPYDGTDRGDCWVEIPAALATWMIETELEPGDWFRVENQDKGPDGRHRFSASIVERTNGSEPE